jgi:hypothetical protein
VALARIFAQAFDVDADSVHPGEIAALRQRHVIGKQRQHKVLAQRHSRPLICCHLLRQR